MVQVKLINVIRSLSSFFLGAVRLIAKQVLGSYLSTTFCNKLYTN